MTNRYRIALAGLVLAGIGSSPAIAASVLKLRASAVLLADEKGKALRDPHGVGCIDAKTFVVADSGNGRVLRVEVSVEDAESMIALAHAAGARVVIDGVAFAPHRAMDVTSLGADWYVYSTYKVFGPHMAVLFGTHAASEKLEGPNHFFIPKHEVPYRFEPGGPSHEGCAGLVALWGYLADLASLAPQDGPSRLGNERAFEQISLWEEVLQAQLLGYLRSKRNVRVVGPLASGPDRVPTVSFVHRSKPSAEIVKAANLKGFGIRYGHFYGPNASR